MSSYITRYCEDHGEWEQDVDDPYEECPDCTELGIAPSQKAHDELKLWQSRALALAQFIKNMPEPYSAKTLMQPAEFSEQFPEHAKWFNSLEDK